MKVDLDCIIFGLQQVGGISTYWFELTRWLAARDDVELHLTLPRGLSPERAAAIASLGVACDTRQLADSVARYLGPGTISDADIVHSSYYRLPPARPGTRRVVTVYDFTYEYVRTGPARWLHSAQKARSVRAADAVICISAATRDDLLRAYPDVDPAKVTAIPLAVSADAFFPLEAHACRDDLADCALFVGARGGYKRFDLAIAGVAAVPHLWLAIVGGPLSAAERAQLDAALPGRWTALGLLDAAGLRQAYASAFALIYPSDHEGFGLPIIEAMACGCPAVVAARGASAEVGGAAAVYAAEQRGADYAGALMALAAYRPVAITAGLTRAAGFTWERTFTATMAAYRAARQP